MDYLPAVIEQKYKPSLLELNSVRFAGVLERTRITLGIETLEWCEILATTWRDYAQYRIGVRPLPEIALERASSYLGLQPEQFLCPDFDVKTFAARWNPKQTRLPERYTKAAHGRRRTSITSIDYIERAAGWRTRVDALKALGVSESDLLDPFATVSMMLITDFCEYLAQRNFRRSDFFEMGAFTYVGNRESLVGRLLSESESVPALYEFFFEAAMPLFERNCDYRLLKIDSRGGVMEAVSNRHVTQEMGVRVLGNVNTCHLKAGVIACLPQYLGLPRAIVHKTACEHQGDHACRFEFEFADLLNSAFSRPTEVSV